MRLVALLWHLCAIFLTSSSKYNPHVAQIPAHDYAGGESDTCALDFSKEWLILGPFKIGTREAVWGSDPLEVLGGFHSFRYNENDTFRSPLCINGTVSWQKIPSKSANTHVLSSVELTISFPEVDWAILRSVYGWAALQYQGWARGYLKVNGPLPRRVILFTDNILEVWLNDVRFFGGDFYAFRRSPLVVTLPPGKHVIDVRLVREIRSMGAADSFITVTLEAQVATNTLRILENTAVLPDLIGGKLPSAPASVAVRNEGESWIEICHCNSTQMVQSYFGGIENRHIEIAPGQSRPITFLVQMSDVKSNNITKTICFRTAGTDSAPEVREISFELAKRSTNEPHKMTFLHPSGVVSYAMLRPPSDIGSRNSSAAALPVLLNLHGAGLEADSHQVRHMLDSVHNLHAWTLFPTGMSPWSGDDWHTWGLADVRAAIHAISPWMEALDWVGPGVLAHKWFVSGHSNGGQGTWHILTHQPDYVIAAAAVSGYLSVETYVPYSMWETAPPSLTAIVHQAMSSFRHELLIENMKGTPIIVQHGSSDDNVPPYHSRLINSLLGKIGANIDYVELPNKGHWFEGAMATNALQAFYRQHLPLTENMKTPPMKFSTVFPSTDDMDSLWGIAVDQLESPDLFGRIDVSRSGKTWQLSTSNIHRLHFDFSSRQIDPPKSIFVDGNDAAWVDGSDPNIATSFVKLRNGSWKAEANDKWKNLHQRFGRQRGALDAIMRTVASFTIRMCSKNSFDIALQVSRNLYQYYYADSAISSCSSHDINQAGNLVTLAIGKDLPVGELETFPISILTTGIEFRRSDPSRTKVVPMEAGLGAIFLRPLENERLELVVWGSDESGLRQAARLIPTLTGVGQADFVVLSKRAAWQGHAGVIAMGFFDFEWRISEFSFV